MNDLITNEYYDLLVEDCKAIVTEAVFVSRWSLVEGYHNLGKRIVNDTNLNRKDIYGKKILSALSKSTRIGERTLYRAIQFYNKFPILAEIPEGKNISWNKIITKYLPEHTEKEEIDEYKRISKGIERWSKAIKGVVDESAYSKISYHVEKIEGILSGTVDVTFTTAGETIASEHPTEDRMWMDIV